MIVTTAQNKKGVLYMQIALIIGMVATLVAIVVVGFFPPESLK